ncbi:MAG TPA: N-acetylmuramoyl-L-alanine amidase [Tangfeifania sp.]|nr:N-acetylmuramoyl-L-alanine amidase [Tangfeifania sp.]
MKPIKIYTIIFLFVTALAMCISGQSAGEEQISNPEIGIVVIDPGHGGRDLGAVSGSAMEKDIVLDIALKLGSYISKAFPEIKVIYTRETDIFVPLYKRAEIANINNADLFISIHVNTVPQPYVQGAETFILGQPNTKDNLEVARKENEVILLEDDYTATYEDFDNASPETAIVFDPRRDEHLEQSALLASAIQQQFREHAKLTDRSVKKAGFLVLRQTAMPGVLVEAGFLSNPNERIYLMSKAGRDYLAHSVFLAFRNYKNKIEEENVNRFLGTEPQKKGIWFSVQVAALSAQKEITPENFNGETNLFEQNSQKLHRYFSGMYSSLEKAQEEKARLQAKFNGAFIVAFEDGKLISVKKALRKM